jgi:hypothetical protein
VLSDPRAYVVRYAKPEAAHEVVRILQGAAPLHVAARPSEVA